MLMQISNLSNPKQNVTVKPGDIVVPNFNNAPYIITEITLKHAEEGKISGIGLLGHGWLADPQKKVEDGEATLYPAEEWTLLLERKQER